MTVTRRIAGHWLLGCRCRAANQRCNYERCRIVHSARSYHFVVAVWRAKGRIRCMEVLDEHHAVERLGLLQVLALILSVYVLAALFIQATVKLSPDTIKVLDWIDFFVCMVFLADFFVRFHRAPSKAKFLKWGWIDFVSSIPMLNIFRVVALSE
jgi:hypothetical protein